MTTKKLVLHGVENASPPPRLEKEGSKGSNFDHFTLTGSPLHAKSSHGLKLESLVPRRFFFFFSAGLPDPASWLNLPSTVLHVVPFPLQTPHMSSCAPEPILKSQPTSWIRKMTQLLITGGKTKGYWTKCTKDSWSVVREMDFSGK